MCGGCLKILNSNIGTEYFPFDVQQDYVRMEMYTTIEQVNCICGQNINNCFPIKNIRTGKKYIIGSVCIEQIFTENPDLIDYATKKLCNICNVKINISSFGEHIKSRIHNLKALYKKCNTCKTYIKKNKQSGICKKCNQKKIDKEMNEELKELKKKYFECSKCGMYSRYKYDKIISCYVCDK